MEHPPTPKPRPGPRHGLHQNGKVLEQQKAKHEVFQRHPIMKFFEYSHLPLHLQKTSKAFHDLAWDLFNSLPPSAETTTALRKLLEGKDAAVRAAL